jgi:hypothetical protein
MSPCGHTRFHACGPFIIPQLHVTEQNSCHLHLRQTIGTSTEEVAHPHLPTVTVKKHGVPVNILNCYKQNTLEQKSCILSAARTNNLFCKMPDQIELQVCGRDLPA